VEAEEAAENVRVRCEVLGVEEERLLGELSELDSRLADQRQQVAGIETQQSNIEQQINQLTHTYVRAHRLPNQNQQCSQPWLGGAEALPLQ